MSEGAAWRPEDAALATGIADELQLKGQFAGAEEAYRRALRVDPKAVPAWYGLGRLALHWGAGGSAIRCLRCALELAPDRADIRFTLGKALFQSGEIERAVEYFRAVAGASDAELRDRALRVIACIIPGSPAADHAAVLHARRAWARLEAEKEIPAAPSRPTANSHGKLRLGYCSAFFHARNWMKPVWGVINHHDRSAFEVHFFSDGPPPNIESGYRENPLDQVHDARGMSNAELASQIAQAGIDILVDLNGYSFQTRLALFMRRPAPVAIAWFNMYATSGVEAFDYIIGDSVVIPASEEPFYCERVLRVPGSYLAYSVLYPTPDVAPPPCLTNGYLTFGSFCSQYKITDQVIAAWAMILRRAPEAKLLIKNSQLGDASSRAALWERFGRYEIPPGRVTLDGPAPHEAFLAAYSNVDVALDTFPYNGGTTTMEALWQGVPVLTFHGDRWASRQSSSLLRAAGLGTWCMSDRDAYIDRAVDVARSPATADQLTSMRATMREHLLATNVCDSRGLCRALERIYTELPLCL